MTTAALAAGEKAGANVVITKKDGTQVAGELICVKRDFITVMNAGNGVNVDLNDIREIKIKDRPARVKAVPVLLGLVSGFVIGFIATDGMSRLSGTRDRGWGPDIRGIGGFIGVPIGGVAGYIAGVCISTSSTYELGGKSTATNSIDQFLAKLDKKARFPGFNAGQEGKDEKAGLSVGFSF